MSFSRVWQVLRLDALHNARRPIFWVLILVLTLLTWGLSNGNVRIGSGNSTVGGTEAHITSQFAVAQVIGVTVLALYGFFLAIAAGMTVIRDEEHKLGELLHATLLSPAEYIWGKFLAVLGSFAAVLGLHLAMSMFFNHALADAATQEYIGPLRVANYLVPALVFGLPMIVFLAGTAFAIGERTRRPILVFVLPLAVMLGTLGFLVSWTPTWLSPSINRLLMLIDPSGFRWLNETWLKVDRGVAFYNAEPIGFDAGFLTSRAVLAAIGLMAVWYSQRRFSATLRGAAQTSRVRSAVDAIGAWLPRAAKRRARHHAAASTAAPETIGTLRPLPLAPLRMSTLPLGFISAAWTVARAELWELLTRPGMYLFVPLVILQATGNVVTVGAFDAPLLLTPGLMAVSMMNALTLMVCSLLLFYMVESLQREFSTGLASIYYATPTPTGAILAGKAVGTSMVGAVILVAALVACVVILLVQQLFFDSPVSVSLAPFAVVWGLILVPTFLVWSAFVMAVYAATRSRYTTYGICIGVIFYTLYKIVGGDGLNWVTNWMAWGVVSWSDMGALGLNRDPLMLNRLYVLGWAVLFVALAVRLFGRQEFDANRVVHRLRPKALAWSTVSLSPFLLLPLVTGLPLYSRLNAGYQSEAAEKQQKDYWRKNLTTWKDAPTPYVTHADIDLVLRPAERAFTVNGFYDLQNQLNVALTGVPLTVGDWGEVTWTVDGAAAESDDRQGLHVLSPLQPLQPSDSVRIGFAYEATLPRGYTKGGGGAAQFVLPAGIVLGSLGPTFVPTVGFVEGIGIDDDNSYEPPEYPDDHFDGITPPAFSNGGPPFTTRVRIVAPEEYTLNSVGSLKSESVADGLRQVVWVSDYPVSFFNVVAGRWDVRRGDGTAVFYHPEHTYNIDEIAAALDASRRFYSEWFYPYPWEELKLSEFPNLAQYAQGFPTNITFSEGIGFLTRNDPRARTAFLVTAHEAAHQWWANLLMPGRGPGGNILSEGMSHFSTMLLSEAVDGVGARIEFAKRIEERYGDLRQVDSERPLVKIDGSRAGDTTVTYDKGGWVAWMLLNLIGRDNMLAGLKEFIAIYNPSPDHPGLQDLVATLRPRAPDAEAFDAFVQQWFFDVVAPEYELSEVRVDRDGTAWEVTATVENVGTGTMSIEVAASRGERFPDDAGTPPDDPTGDTVTASGASTIPEVYAEARSTVVLAAGESARVAIRCDFEPERLVVDPDALVLQLRRENAVFVF